MEKAEGTHLRAIEVSELPMIDFSNRTCTIRRMVSALPSDTMATVFSAALSAQDKLAELRILGSLLLLRAVLGHGVGHLLLRWFEVDDRANDLRHLILANVARVVGVKEQKGLVQSRLLLL